jgi:hypothetical protein
VKFVPCVGPYACSCSDSPTTKKEIIDTVINVTAKDAFVGILKSVYLSFVGSILINI